MYEITIKIIVDAKNDKEARRAVDAFKEQIEEILNPSKESVAIDGIRAIPSS